MDALRTELWERIQGFELDKPGDSLTFTSRLARENGWSIGYARRVVEEYRRFLFLTMVAGHEVTPSEQVDEAWHLHIVYTKRYWGDLCRNVLRRPLHHNPTRGGPAESARHHEQYERTLESYRAQFGEEAPTDIWPPADVRFGEDLDHVRVNRARNWIVPKPRLRRGPAKRSSWLFTTALAPLVLGITNPLDMTGPEFLGLYGVLTAVVLVAAFALRNVLRSDEPTHDPEPLQPYEVACLGRGAAGAMQSCLAGLVAEGSIEVVETPAKKLGPIPLGNSTYKLRASVTPETAKSEIERSMLQIADFHEGVDATVVLTAAKPVAETVESMLQSRGLLETNDSFGPARWWPLILIGGLAALGAVKLVVGLARGKPVLFLVFWLIALAIFAVFFARKPHRTKRGERMFKDLKQKHEGLRTTDFARPGACSAADMMLVTGLFGLAAVSSHPQVHLLQGALKPIAPSDGGLGGTAGGCGSGCGGGGGGCGGGCGGCGGD
jgi:uncharacterized protein (TIGR04222 family)